MINQLFTVFKGKEIILQVPTSSTNFILVQITKLIIVHYVLGVSLVNKFIKTRGNAHWRTLQRKMEVGALPRKMAKL